VKLLKPEYQQVADDFNRHYSDRGCSCHISPPCGFCTHEGNPLNLHECEDVWIGTTPRIISNRRAKYLRKRGKDVYWNAEFYCWVYNREVAHG